MKVPKARKLPTGTWFIQLRLGGKSIPVHGRTEKECIRAAQRIKADYLDEKREASLEEEPKDAKLPTLAEAEDKYIEQRTNRRSPATLRGYYIIRKTRFTDMLDKSLSDITKDDWENAVESEAAKVSAKTLTNSWRFVCSVLRNEGITPPKITLPQIVPNEHPFLEPDEVQVFMKGAEGNKYEIAMLLALHSLRVSEICGLQWENVHLGKKYIEVRGAVVPNKENQMVWKKENKNRASTRSVPILMDRLYVLLKAQAQKSGPVCPYHPNTIFKAINKVCEQAGLPKVGVHGLRHSFASLCFHLNVPELLAMKIGGWSDDKTMKKIYTHIASKDMSRYQGELTKFFSGKENANENANAG